MQLTIDSLKSVGGFITGALVKKDITWVQGGTEVTATVYVRPLSFHTAVSEMRSGHGVASRIASSICDEHGVPVFTVADIDGTADPERGPIDAKLTEQLLVAISEVNGFVKKPVPTQVGKARMKKSSPTRKKSGTS